MTPRFACLAVLRVLGLLSSFARSDRARDGEVFILRHRVAVLQRQVKAPGLSRAVRVLVLEMARTIPAGDSGACTANWPGSAAGSRRRRCGRSLRTRAIDPAPRRSGQAWRAFLEAQAIPAAGFSDVGTVILRRLQVLFFRPPG